MADSLIFGASFDFSKTSAKGKEDAEKAVKRIQDFLNSKPMILKLDFDTTSLQHFERNYKRSIDGISNSLETLNRAWNSMKISDKFDASGNLTPKAERLVEIYKELTAASQTYGQTLSQIVRKQQKDVEAQIKAEEKRIANIKKLRDALSANEKTLEGLNAKMKAYQSALQSREVGSEKWNKTALEIRRLSEELSIANQRMRDFQQTAFKGIGDNFTKQQVEQLTRLREQLALVDAEIHKVQQLRVQTGIPTYEADRMNDSLKERMRITKEINAMLTTASDLQLQREKEINKIVEQRKAKADAIAAKKAEETRQTQANIARLKEERAILNKQENSIANITAKLQIQQQRLNSAQFGSKAFDNAIKEVERLTKKLQEAQREIDNLTGKSDASANRQVQSLKKVTNEYGRQEAYLRNLTTRIATYASIGAMGAFLQRVRDVTAEFELQRISLGAIIQDQNRANQLFSEIKSFALKSPVKILDLTKYVKQVAAYRIETDKLFDTTKRLADISVGLGVDMQRIVLAYGQVRAATYLRAAEVRQFTEAGIPLLELLAEKFSKLKGEMVSTAEVMDLISKRGVQFSDVEEIFKDMTDAGGMFYNMQEKQGNTLYGMWAKLGDAASVMYDKIGNTKSVNNAMRRLIELFTDLMRNWEASFAAIATLSGTIGAGLLFKRVAGAGENVLNKQVTIATNERIKAETNLKMALLSRDKAEIQAARSALKNAEANETAAIAERNRATTMGKLSVGFKSMLSTMSSMFAATFWITALTAIISYFVKWYQETTRLKNELSNIYSSTFALQRQSVDNFERLADAAVYASSGSQEQKKALDELNRTYGQMLPKEALTIANLRKLREGAKDASTAYARLTQTVREYIAEQQRQRSLNAIQEEYGTIQTDATKKIREAMRKDEVMSDEEIQRFFVAFQKTAMDSTKTVKEQFIQAFEDAGLKGAEQMWNKVKKVNKAIFTVGPGIFGSEEANVLARSAIGALSKAQREEVEQTNAVNKAYESLNVNLKQYTSAMLGYKEAMSKLPVADTFAQERANVATQINTMAQEIKAKMEAVGLTWKDEWANIIRVINPKDLTQMSSIQMQEILDTIDPAKYPELYDYITEFQKLYGELVPKDITVQLVRNKLYEVAGGLKDGGKQLKNYLIGADQDIADYVKSLGETMEDKAAEIYEMEAQIAQGGVLMSATLKATLADAKEQLAAMTIVYEFAKLFAKPKETKSRGGTKSDTRLQELNEIEQALTTINAKYDDLLKKEGQIKALEHINEIYKDQLAYINEIGKKFKLSFQMPTNFKTLQDYRNAILDVIKTLKSSKLKGADKAALELEMKIGTGNVDELQKDIERKLKDLQSRIEQSKTAKEFYDKILSATGDVNIAANVTMSIYGDTGEGIDAQMAKYIKEMFDGYDIEVPVSVIADNNQINYKALAEFVRKNEQALGGVDSKTYQELTKIAQQGQKDWAKTYEGYLKDLEKAKSYSDKRVELARTTANEIIKIRNSELPEEEKGRLIAGFNEKEAKEAAKLEWEAFKDTPMYVQMFADLDYTSTTMLKNMQSMLQRLKGQWGDSLDPTQLKEMQKRMQDISDQLAKRNPFKAISDGISKIRELNKEYGSLKSVESQLANATNDLVIAKSNLEIYLNAEAKAREQLAKNKEEYGDDSEQVRQSEQIVKNTSEQVRLGKEAVDNAEKQAKAAEEVAGQYADANDEIGEGVKNLKDYVDKVKEAWDAVRETVETWSALGDDELWNAIMDGMDSFNESAGLVAESAQAYLSGDMFTAITKAISATAKLVTAIGKIFWGAKVAKANKEIKRQQELLEDLEYTYSRLQKASDKLFGTDYIQNYNQQLENLQARAEAYRKQAIAERSKGKKADEEKFKEYKNNYIEALDEMKDMQDELVAHFAGTDISSAARDFANSWLEARWAFEDTTEAMREKFADMVQNMIVESLAARLMQNILDPIYNMIDEAMDDQEITTQELAAISAKAYDSIGTMNNAMETMLEQLQAAGMDLSQMFSEGGADLTGISRDIATASEESINGLAQGINTQNYYISHVPTISENVAAIRILMEGGAVAQVGGDYNTLQNEHLAQLPIIAANTLATAERCERAAIACEEMRDYIARVVVSKANGSALNTRLLN